MIKEIRLKNWKSFKDATLYIDPLTVLIGTNASGKSNALDAIEFLKMVVQGKDFDSIFKELRGGAEWASLKPGHEFELEVLIEINGETDYLYSLCIDKLPKAVMKSEQLIAIRTDSMDKEVIGSFNESSFRIQGENLGIIPTDYEVFVKKSFIWGSFYGQVLKAKVSDLILIEAALTRMFIFDPIPSRMRDYAPFSEKLSKNGSNLSGVLAALPNSEKAEVEKTLARYVSHLPEKDIRKVWAEPVGRLQKDAMLYCEEEWIPGQPPTLVDASGMSDGTLRFLAILSALLTSPPNSLIVIEEVDNGLHPSRAGLLLQMIREIGTKRNIDVLVTTHNPALLDALGPEMTPFVTVAHRNPDTGVSELTLLEDIQTLPKLLASGPLGKAVTRGELEKTLSKEHTDKDAKQ
ncbi:hypothetical protein CBW65_02915 [Tumebacillus avium]|uniref:ATPase n=1 Tax=Tumebacillus avium TaxID=1903704 RepID=A0A1Y0IKT0_9BACL|nr:ATP-binding protein [Tumebacillus avium]ARU60125.1 hypothetical protein CBW65_02915 [Tumebacillus avium]